MIVLIFLCFTFTTGKTETLLLHPVDLLAMHASYLEVFDFKFLLCICM